MSDISLAVTDAIIAALKADAGVRAFLGDPARVYDDVPSDVLFPFVKVEIGSIQADLADDYEGYEILPKIDVWSRAVGSVEAKQIAAAIFGALRPGVALDSNRMLSLTRYIDNFETDGDGITKHAILMLRGVAEL